MSRVLNFWTCIRKKGIQVVERDIKAANAEMIASSYAVWVKLSRLILLSNIAKYALVVS
jgi:hypothetical protein